MTSVWQYLAWLPVLILAAPYLELVVAAIPSVRETKLSHLRFTTCRVLEMKPTRETHFHYFLSSSPTPLTFFSLWSRLVY
jgi:hypothetical protein